MPLITEDGVPHTLRAGDESLTPEVVRRYTEAAATSSRLGVFVCIALAIMFGFRGVLGLTIILGLPGIVFALTAYGVQKNKTWARKLGIAMFTFAGGLLILSVIMTARQMLAMSEGNVVAVVLTLFLVAAAGGALCYFPHRWFAPPK